jgi:hypothetical protein
MVSMYLRAAAFFGGGGGGVPAPGLKAYTRERPQAWEGRIRRKIRQKRCEIAFFIKAQMNIMTTGDFYDGVVPHCGVDRSR